MKAKKADEGARQEEASNQVGKPQIVYDKDVEQVKVHSVRKRGKPEGFKDRKTRLEKDNLQNSQ